MTELEAQAKKISELGNRLGKVEKKHQELENLVYKISHELTPRIWKLEHPEGKKGEE